MLASATPTRTGSARAIRTTAGEREASQLSTRATGDAERAHEQREPNGHVRGRLVEGEAGGHAQRARPERGERDLPSKREAEQPAGGREPERQGDGQRPRRELARAVGEIPAGDPALV